MTRRWVNNWCSGAPWSAVQFQPICELQILHWWGSKIHTQSQCRWSCRLFHRGTKIFIEPNFNDLDFPTRFAKARQRMDIWRAPCGSSSKRFTFTVSFSSYRWPSCSYRIRHPWLLYSCTWRSIGWWSHYWHLTRRASFRAPHRWSFLLHEPLWGQFTIYWSCHAQTRGTISAWSAKLFLHGSSIDPRWEKNIPKGETRSVGLVILRKALMLSLSQKYISDTRQRVGFEQILDFHKFISTKASNQGNAASEKISPDQSSSPPHSLVRAQTCCFTVVERQYSPYIARVTRRRKE